MWRVLLILLLALILGRFLVVGMPKVLFNQLSSDGDESAYLSLGLALRETGRLSDGTRPPLYSAVLAFFAEREWRYFTTAKLATLAMGALTVLAVFLVGVRLYGWETALLAAFLIAANKEFHVRASTVYADTLLALIMVGAWYFLIKSVEGWKHCVLAGFFVGLTFLTKGSAPVLLVAWGLMALFHFRWRLFRHFELLLVPAVFIVTALPLLIYNATEFGSPTYNFATQHIMWMDQLEQINTADPDDLPTRASYFATHTLADMVDRVQKGLRRLNPVVTRSVIPGRRFDPAWLGPVLALLGLAVLGFLVIFRRPAVKQYLARNQNPLLITLFLCSLFYASFTWYVAGSSAETRFVIPLLGPLYLILADVVVSLLRGVGRWLGALDGRYFQKQNLLLAGYRVLLALIIGWGVWWLVGTSQVAAWALAIDPYESDRVANAEAEEVVQWLSRDNPDDEVLVAFGPSKSLPLWKFPARFTFERLSFEVDAWSDMQSYVQSQAPAYIIIDEDTARRRREALAVHFRRDNERVMFEQTPPGWVLDYVYPALPCRWCIFSPAPNLEPLATLANGIELLAWQSSDPSGQAWPDPSSPLDLRVTLSWRIQQPVAQDYTVFVHLTAPDSFVIAQSDRQPFDQARPTSQWQPGEILADRYDLRLEHGLAAGHYLLLAGMYDPATGERLEIIDGPTGPAPNTILLGSFQIDPE